MIRVTIDIFSGRENPSWLLDEQAARTFLREIALNRSVVSDDAIESVRLGYRGTRVETLHEHIHEEFNLPATFTLASGASAADGKAIEIVERLIGEAGSSAATPRSRSKRGGPQSDAPAQDATQELADPKFRKFLRDEVSGSPPPRHATAPAGGPSADATGVAPCAFETLPFTPAFWNDPAHVRINNCYAYATNRRTDTFPQPGRASGHPAQAMACPNVTAASISDGAHQANNCFPDTARPRLYVAMVIWPGRDYHWYRFHSEGFWGHKPGQTPARNVDNSNVVIKNPETCNRGGYTSFCGYFLIPNNIRVT